jgi:hypothetical protein
MKFRPDAQRVEVYNEGLAVYLHDPANAAAIVAANPQSIIAMSDVEPSKDKALKKIVEQGLLVTYFLRQDDSIVVDVSVGPPLDKAEIKAIAKQGVPLMKPTQTVISLPSGRLRIDTANTFRLSEESRAYAAEYEKTHGNVPADNDLKAFGLEDESGEIAVPPGDYVLSLYRVDFEKMEDREEDGFPGPGEFITLTPAGEIERPKRIPAAIEYGHNQPRVAGLNKWKIEDGRFLGVMAGGCVSNFRWKHAEKLGLRRGQHLRLRHDNKDYDAVYLGGVEPRSDHELCSLIYPDMLEGFRAQHPDWLTAGIHESTITKTALLYIQSQDPKVYLTSEQGSALEIEGLDDFVLPAPPEGPVPQGSCEGGAIRGTVLAAGACGLELGCGAKTIKSLRAGKAAELMLRIGGKEARLLLIPSAEHRNRPHHIAGSAKREDERLFRDVFAYMYQGGDEVFRAFVGEARSVELVKLLKEYQKGCTFTPRDGYVPHDPELAETQRERSMALWREGVGRYAEAGALYGLLTPHWDDRKATSLSCRVIAYQGVNFFAEAAGEIFEIKRAE